MVVGASELGQDESVEGIGLTACGPKARSGSLQLVGMYREHRESRFEHTFDQEAVGSLDRHALDTRLDQHGAQRDDTPLVVGEAAFAEQAPVFSDDAEPVFVFGPIHSRTPGHLQTSFARSRGSDVADRRVPLRLLIGWRFGARRPVAASGAPHRREAQVSCGPSTKGLAQMALSRRWSAFLRASQSEATRHRGSTHLSFEATEQRKVAL